MNGAFEAQEWQIFLVGSGMGDKLKNLVNLLRGSPNKDLAREFLSASNYDLNAAKVLKKDNINSLAIFHLQQGIEKLCKSLFLFDNRRKVSDKTLRNHNSLEIIEAWTFKNQKIRSLLKHPLSGIFMEEKGLLRSPLTVIRGLLIGTMSATFKNLGLGGSIDKLFEHERLTQRSILFEKRDEVAMEVAKFSTDKIEKLFRDIKNAEQQSKQSARSFNSGYSEEQFAFLDGVIDLLGLAFLTFPHEDSSRYPTSKIGISYKEYNENKLGIVLSFEMLIEIAENAQKSIDNVLS